MTTTTVGMFADFTEALNTIPDLVSLGVAQQNISTIAQDSNGEYAKFLRAEANTDSGSHVGASVAVGSYRRPRPRLSCSVYSRAWSCDCCWSSSCGLCRCCNRGCHRESSWSTE
jgi:hypothetical protein